MYTKGRSKLDTHPWCGGHHSVGKHEEVEADQLENILEEANDLQGEHVLQGRSGKQVSWSPAPPARRGLTPPRPTPRPTCLQSSPTLKMAACQQTLREPSAFSSPSSSESEGQRSPSLSSSLTPQRLTLNLAR